MKCYGTIDGAVITSGVNLIRHTFISFSTKQQPQQAAEGPFLTEITYETYVISAYEISYV